MENYTAVYLEASQAFANGEPQQAFQRLRWLLHYPGHPELYQNWREALSLFAQIGAAIADEAFALKVRRVAEAPNDLQTLYDLGYELIEYSLPEIAATILARANKIAPTQPTILSELVAALEMSRHSSEACRVLRQAPELLEENSLFLYLLAFNALMTGDLVEPKQLLVQLQQNPEPSERWMAERIEEMLQRADVLQGITRLDRQDLRGWHFVLTGGILLHLSPYGLDQGMNGRYAYTQDDESRILHGIQRLSTVIDTWNISVPRVFMLPHRDSTILAHAVAQILSCPLQEWTPETCETPGLIVTYDLRQLDSDILEQLSQHRPSQMLWSHASCWTQEQWFTADLTTYLYQHNVSPWQERTGVDPDSDELKQFPAIEGSFEELATRIVKATPDPDELDDLPKLIAIAQAARTVTKESAKPGAFRQSGQRNRQWLSSPVTSSQFL
ncbi:hypothetical protein [Dendronalium sp. ChiSLP03b]|uniref:hypothetical protein n=1 Tax=Dendronalium sp. ChiSLP03b TaxID=3075381 RepID=UPI002AD30561|nr:hypothetical protein [Dendronalium sp. ChiSLP03b]MDZ8204725.1 hypothetical protein [Dendronalium sp. ChiSLP03b]